MCYSVSKILKNKNPKTTKLVSPVNGINQYSYPRVNKLNLMRKHQTNPNWGTFDNILLKMSVMKHEENPRNYSKLKEMTTKCNVWTWIGSGRRTCTFITSCWWDLNKVCDFKVFYQHSLPDFGHCSMAVSENGLFLGNKHWSN